MIHIHSTTSLFGHLETETATIQISRSEQHLSADIRRVGRSTVTIASVAVKLL